jgi:bifunctional DNA-binding transcriptional regulator/antitoxin component of YhaV-PrlF toxin-antitoxin module
MNYTNSITSKGQITLPQEFREKLGLNKIGNLLARARREKTGFEIFDGSLHKAYLSG